MSNTVEIIIKELQGVEDDKLVETIQEKVLPKIQNNFLMRTLMGTISERKVLNDFIRDFILQELQELSTWNRNRQKQMKDEISQKLILEPVIINKIEGSHNVPLLNEEGVYDRRTIENILRNNKGLEIQYHELEFEKSRLTEYVKEFYEKTQGKIELFFMFCDFVGYEVNHSKPFVPRIRELFALANMLCVVEGKSGEFVEFEQRFFTKFGSPKEKFDIVKLAFNMLVQNHSKKVKKEGDDGEDEIWEFYKNKIYPFFHKEEVEGEEEDEGEEEGGKKEEPEEEKEDAGTIDPSEDPLFQLIRMGNQKALNFHMDTVFSQKEGEDGDITTEELEELISLAGKSSERYVIRRCLDKFPKNEVLKAKVLNIAMDEGDEDLFIKFCGDDKEIAIRVLFKAVFELKQKVKSFTEKQ